MSQCRLVAVGLAAALAVGAVSTALAQPASGYSGRATVLGVTAPVVGSVTLGDTGPLPPSGGRASSSVAGVDLAPLLTAGAGSATTQGQGNHARSSASLSNLALTLPANIPITGSAVRSEAQASCQNGTPQTSGGAQVADLVVNGTPVVASTPNLTISVLGLATVVVNEQSSSTSGSYAQETVNALHVSVPVAGIDVVVAHSEADITCA